MHRSLIIGYGNIDRADDGVAYDVINALRRRLGQEILHEGDTGLEDLGRPIDSVFLSQLAPELMEKYFSMSTDSQMLKLGAKVLSADSQAADHAAMRARASAPWSGRPSAS